MITLTKYGKREWATATAMAVILLIVSGWLTVRVDTLAGCSLGVAVIIVWLAFVAFFRDPARPLPEVDASVLLSPADGVIRDCELIPGSNCGNEELAKLFGGKDMLRIGIFLSVFDVHLNRAPCDMMVQFTFHKNGTYHDARNPKAIGENESQITGGIGDIQGMKFPVAVKQISGAIARRIVCPVDPGQEFKKGERYGMIKFGSRTELYLPVKSGFTPMVNIGDRVFGGITPIAKYEKKES